MSETKHSPEPWARDASEAVDGIVDAGGNLCAESWPGDTMNLDPEHPEPWLARQEANRRRIVAAVNACAGIPTAALEAGAINLAIATLHLVHECQPDKEAVTQALRALGGLSAGKDGER